MRLVLDTNVMVAAMRSPSGASAKLVRAVRDGAITMIVSPALFLEYEAVLTRTEHMTAAGLSRAEVDTLLMGVASVLKPAPTGRMWRPLLDDADDEMVLEAAINGAAAILVTFEVRTFQAAAQRFGIEVLTPGATCARMML